MSQTQVLEDGSTLIVERPSRFIMERPTYGTWLKFLLSRDAAVSYRDGERVVTKTIDMQPAKLTDGEITIKCIACGTKRRRMDMNKITIGGMVRMPEEEQTGKDEVTRRTVLRPVSKTGLGCPACQVMFQSAVRATAQENALRERLSNTQAALEDAIDRVQAVGKTTELKRCEKHPSMRGFCACLKTHATAGNIGVNKAKAAKGTSKLTPWIDVFDVSNGFTVEPKEQ